jgi:tetratricopeptide (TPR) repeat protein
VKPDVAEVKVEGGLDQAMQGYRRFLEQTKETAMTPEAMRRLADLQLEKQFGIRNDGATPKAMAAPAKAAVDATPSKTAAVPGARESDEDFERRTTTAGGASWAEAATAVPDAEGPERGYRALRQAARRVPELQGQRPDPLPEGARLDELGRTEEAIATMERLIKANPSSCTSTRSSTAAASTSSCAAASRTPRRVRAVIGLGARSSYYELSLYKLGWTLYKQDDYEGALHRYMALLDYKVSIGYDFDATHEEDDERRVADTFRVISLSFVNLGGGPPTLAAYFARFGNRAYEDRIYANLGEHYLEKLRYDDAANTLKAFVALYPSTRRHRVFHAGHRDLHPGRLPQARARGEAGLRGDVRPLRPLLEALHARRSPEVVGT